MFIALWAAPDAGVLRVNLCCRYVESLVEQEIAAGIPSNRVVVAGFSQGGAVALMMLRSKHKLAGIVGESPGAASSFSS